MQASSFPRVCRAWNLDTNEMLDAEKLITLGFTISPDGLPAYRERPFPVVVMWCSGQKDSGGKMLFEGDICKVEIANEFGSVSIDYGIMRWNAQHSQFSLMVPSMQGGLMLDLKSANLLGNEFENPELNPLVKLQPVNG